MVYPIFNHTMPHFIGNAAVYTVLTVGMSCPLELIQKRENGVGSLSDGQFFQESHCAKNTTRSPDGIIVEHGNTPPCSLSNPVPPGPDVLKAQGCLRQQ